MTTDAVAATQSVLDAMVAGVMARKSAPSGLSPVGTERGSATAGSLTLPPRAEMSLAGPIPADFPWDMPLQNITSVIGEIRRQIAFLESGLVAIERAAMLREGGPLAAVSKSQGKVNAVVDKEAASQAAFDADLAAKTARAQAEVYEPSRAPLTNAEKAAYAALTDPDISTWLCPTHKKAKPHVSPRGRHFMACPTCDLFEKPEGR